MRRLKQGITAGNLNTAQRARLIEKGAKIATIAHVILPMFFQMAANGFRFDGEDETEAALLGNIRNLFLVGEVVATLTDELRSRMYSYQASPIETMVTDSKIALNKIMNAAEEALNGEGVEMGDIIDVALRLSDISGYAFGLPFPGVERMTRGVADVVQGETEYPLRRILGWTERMITPPEEEEKEFTISEKLKKSTGKKKTKPSTLRRK